MNLNLYNIIVLLGAVQGFILAGVFLTSKKLHRKANFFLALLLISLSIINLANALWDMGFVRQHPLLAHLPLTWTLLIPFALHYVVQYLIDPAYRFSARDYWLLLPFAVQQAVRLPELWLFLTNPGLLPQQQPLFDQLAQGFERLAVVYTVVVFGLAIWKINRFDAQLQNQFSAIESRSLAWLKQILVTVALLLSLWVVPLVLALVNHTNVNVYMYPLWIGMSAAVYWLAYALFSRRDLFEFTTSSALQPVDNEVDTFQTKLVWETWGAHYQALTRLVETEKLYLDPDISMTVLAEKMGLSNGYLSQIINQQEGLNFYDYINRYRVEAVKQRLVDPKFDYLSLYGLALDCGFKSKSTFNGVFKKITGLTPSDYRNQQATTVQQP